MVTYIILELKRGESVPSIGVAHMWEWEGVYRPISMAIYFLAFMFVLESTRGHSIGICVLFLRERILDDAEDFAL